MLRLLQDRVRDAPLHALRLRVRELPLFEGVRPLQARWLLQELAAHTHVGFRGRLSAVEHQAPSAVCIC